MSTTASAVDNVVSLGMRWLVEVSSIGKTDLQKFCVEAESWQRALQAARAQRGEDGPMSGFSIELLEEGYRAVDPMARVRFVVKRAPDDTPITAGTPPATGKDGKSSVAPSPASATDPKMTPPPSPSSSSSRTSAAVPPPAPSSNGSAAKKGPPRPSASNPPPAPAAQADVAKAQTMALGSKGDTAVAARPATPAVGTQTPGLPTVKLLTKREQEPTEASPLTYREYAFAVPEGTTEEVAADVLRAQLRLVEGSIAGAKMGKLVNLAVFDVEFTGKPPRAPLATLAWKDWKGDPVVGFPRRGGSVKPPPSPDQVPASFPPAAVAAPVSVAPVPAAVAVAPAPPPPSAPPPPPAAPPAPIAAPITAPVAFPVPAAAMGPMPAPVLTEAEPKRPSVPPEAGMVRTPSGRFVRGRVTGDELITALFESMHDLHFLRDALDGGQFCLALATEVLPARAALIHFFDVEKREWVVACTRGKETQRLLAMRTPEGDELLREAARKRRALVVANATQAAGDRYRHLGGSRSLIVAPIMQAGRALGALEIINPLDGMPFTEDEGNAMTYIAEQFAEYLGSRGIVLDRERIHSAAAR